MSERVCFVMRVRPSALDEYKRRHADVWPELRALLTAAGWRNYSLFSVGDGMIIGYCEMADREASLAIVGENDVNARWQAEMAPMFELERAPDIRVERLEEIFHLE